MNKEVVFEKLPQTDVADHADHLLIIYVTNCWQNTFSDPKNKIHQFCARSVDLKSKVLEKKVDSMAHNEVTGMMKGGGIVKELESMRPGCDMGERVS